jgi:ABC-2 type transport system ATP-binding protein
MIKTENVVKTFTGDDRTVFTALNDISITIETGGCYGLIGDNGAGKSTLLRLMSGIYKPNGGTVTMGEGMPYENPAVKEKIFFVNDETLQYNNFRLEEMRDFYKFYYPSFDTDKWERLRQSLNLPLNKRLSLFSKGMKRQSTIITAIACKPKFLLLDEAFDGIDPMMRLIVKNMLIDEMLDGELTTVISSHNLKEIDEFCDRAGFLHGGELLFDKALDDVKGNVVKAQCLFETEPDLTGLDIMQKETEGSITYLIVKADADTVKEKLSPQSPKLLDIVPLTLEEVFIYEMQSRGYYYGGKEEKNEKNGGNGNDENKI